MQETSLLGVAAAFITGGGLAMLLKFILDIRSKNFEEQQQKRRDEIQLAKIAQESESAAELRADCEAENRRRIQEECGGLRAEAAEHGYTPRTPRASLLTCGMPIKPTT